MKDNGLEIGLMLRDIIDGTAEELEKLIPDIKVTKPKTDAEIAEALRKMSPAGWQSLFETEGEENVLEFIHNFSQGRKW